jgi:hypothetical protein
MLFDAIVALRFSFWSVQKVKEKKEKKISPFTIKRMIL